MGAWLGFGIVVGIVTLLGALMAYSLKAGRRVVAGIFGLPGSAQHRPRGVQEEDPPPRWNMRG